MIPSLEAVKAINTWRGDAVVVSATSALREWTSVSGRRDLDLDLSDCMDKAASVGLGVALAQPRRRVLVLDCDSVLRTNLSTLMTIGAAAPTNLVHFLFEDSGHLSTDGKPIPGLERIAFEALANDGGYPRTYHYDDLEEFVISLRGVLEGVGPTFVSLRVVHDKDMPGYSARTVKQSFETVKAALVPEQAG